MSSSLAPTHPRILAAILCIVWFFPPLPVPAKEVLGAAEAPIDLQDGDVFVFLGDSITHQCLYTQYVEDFFFTRYPERRIRFHNAGVSGDRAINALDRFEDDVAALKPKYVSILLGMNDGEYEDFDSEIFKRYEEGMRLLLEKIEASGARAVVMTPTMFDHRQLGVQMKDPGYRFRDRTFSPHYNAVLAFYGAWLRERAGEQRLPFVNLWGPLNDITMEERRADPGFTLIPDGFHPAPAGQFVMAFSFLQQLQPDRMNVSAISMVWRGAGGWSAGGGGGFSGIEGDAAHLRFTFTAKALPWVIPEVASEAADLKWEMEPGAHPGYVLTHAGHKLSNERLRVAGLAPGSYEVLIDGQSIGKPVSHVTLGTKIELQSNPGTPQYQQALEVALLNRERNDRAVRPLRDVWAKIKGIRRNHPDEPDAKKANEEIAKLRPQIEELQSLAAEFEERIYAANQPVPRKYEIRKVK